MGPSSARREQIWATEIEWGHSFRELPSIETSNPPMFSPLAGVIGQPSGDGATRKPLQNSGVIST